VTRGNARGDAPLRGGLPMNKSSVEFASGIEQQLNLVAPAVMRRASATTCATSLQ
jgi:hypothetical protein